ncbi:MAG: DoxX family protein [Pseudomonadota bacterium]
MSSWLTLRAKAVDHLDGLGLLALRLWIGHEFVMAGYTKLSGGLSAPDWFAGLVFPFPHHWLGADLNWLIAGTGEVILGAALVLGVFSRLASIGLLYITYVAIYTVHFDLGWTGWNQIDTADGLGFKVPLMLAVMLLAIVTQGGGKYSLDALTST